MFRHSVVAWSWTTAAALFQYDELAAANDIWIHQALDCPSSQGADLAKWSCGLACEQAVLSNVAVLQDTDVDTYAIAAWSGDECVLAFRGTKNAANIVADVDIVTVNPYGRAACPKCKVHKGFYDSWQSLQGQARTALAKLGCSQVRITGHSLGASIASLAAYELSLEYQVSAVYTYGQPRTGNTHWVSAFAERLVDVPYFRVVDFKDPIPHLISQNMFFQGWEHQVPEVYYQATQLGEYIICNEQQNKTCSAQWNTLECQLYGCMHCSYLGMNPCDCGVAEPQCTSGGESLV